jgi:hypothetical protein
VGASIRFAGPATELRRVVGKIAKALRVGAAAVVVAALFSPGLAGGAEATARAPGSPRKGPPVNTALPVISGVALGGETLSCSPGTWTGRPPLSFSFQWLRDEAAIPGAGEATYLVPASGEGFTLTCQVTASNRAGQQAARSLGISVLATCCDGASGATPPVNIKPPVVSGSPVPGSALSCSPGVWSGTPPPSLSYHWLRDGVAIAGETGPEYTVPKVEAPTRLACEVRASNAAGKASARSATVTVAYGALAPAEAVALLCGRSIELYSPEEIRSALAAGLACSRRARIAGVRKRGGFAFAFKALRAGTVSAAWYHVRPGAGRAGKAKVREALVLSGHARCRGGDVVVTARLTRIGRALLRRATRIKLMAKAIFTPAGGRPTTVIEEVVLRS